MTRPAAAAATGCVSCSRTRTDVNFQEICRELGSRCEVTGYSGIVPGTSTGYQAKVVGWARDAWRAIQQEHEWTFLRKPLNFLTVAGQADYLPANIQVAGAPVRSYDVESIRIYRNAVGRSDEQFLVEWSWREWYDTYGYGDQVDGRPTLFAVRPDDNAIVLGAIPDDEYRVVGYYWRQAQELAQPSDEPIIDGELHMAIVYKAMLSYANTEAASEVKLEAQERLDEIMSLMCRRYLPAGDSRGPLA